MDITSEHYSITFCTLLIESGDEDDSRISFPPFPAKEMVSYSLISLSAHSFTATALTHNLQQWVLESDAALCTALAIHWIRTQQTRPSSSVANFLRLMSTLLGVSASGSNFCECIIGLIHEHQRSAQHFLIILFLFLLKEKLFQISKWMESKRY